MLYCANSRSNMPEKIRSYTVALTDIDHIKVRQVRNGRYIRQFSVQYEALIESRWRKITRFDNSHSAPHRHVYYANNKEYKHPMSTTDNNQAFTEAQILIKKNFIDMRERYILSLDRGGEI